MESVAVSDMINLEGYTERTRGRRGKGLWLFAPRERDPQL